MSRWFPIWRGGRVPRKWKKRIDLRAAWNMEFVAGFEPDVAAAWTRKRQPRLTAGALDRLHAAMESFARTVQPGGMP